MSGGRDPDGRPPDPDAVPGPGPGGGETGAEPAGRGTGTPRRRLAAFAAVSAGFHLMVFLIPLAWWQAVPWVGGGGDEEGASGRGGDLMVVSLVDLPAPAPAEEPAELPVEPSEDRAVPEVVEPAPEPELPALPAPAVHPPEPARTATEGGAGEGAGAAGAENGAGSGRSGTDAEGVPGPGEPEPRYRPPRLLAGALPLTPEESRDLDMEGPLEISVRLRVGTDGLVREVRPDDPGLPPRLVDALERSARAMRFVPARLGDEPVEAWFSMTFVYRR